MKSQEEHIEDLKKIVEDHLGWGAATSWHSKMFEELSQKVFQQEQVMLSITTLKRFFGVVKYNGQPSVTTLDALAGFVGQEDWIRFKTGKRVKKTQQRIPNRSVYISIGFVLAVITLSLLSNRRPDLVIDSSEFEFSSAVLSREYPNSVVFDFSIPSSLKAEKLAIQQYWDPSMTINIKPDQSQATGIYYFPGYFRAKLLVDDQVAQSHDLFLKSDGWLGMIEYEGVPKYFAPQVKGSSLYFTEEVIDEVSALEKPVVSSFHYIDEIGDVSGDNFTFSANIQNIFDDRWAVCQAMTIYFIGTTGAMLIPFSKIGCSSENNLMLNDTYLSGKEHDLSALSANFSQPISMKLEVANKLMHVIMNGDEVYKMNYQSSMGRLVGVRFKFEGLAKVIDFKLQNQTDSIIPLL